MSDAKKKYTDEERNLLFWRNASPDNEMMTHINECNFDSCTNRELICKMCIVPIPNEPDGRVLYVCEQCMMQRLRIAMNTIREVLIPHIGFDGTQHVLERWSDA